jgi:superfamily II DNA or RNA helicase
MPGWTRIQLPLPEKPLTQAQKIGALLDRFKGPYSDEVRIPYDEVTTPDPPAPEIQLPLDDDNLDIESPDVDDSELQHLSADDTVYPLIPRDYQIQASAFMQAHKRALNTDDTGLGKTLEAAEAAVGPTVVAAPTHLTEQWFDFLCKQYPESTVVLASGSRKQRTEAIRTVGADWYVINHQMFRSYGMPDGIGTLIIDEAHHFRNRGAMQTKMLYAFVENNPDVRVYLLTATPTYTSVDNIWSMLHIIDPVEFPSYSQFVDTFCTTMFDPHDHGRVIGTRRTRRAELKKIIDFVRIGRTYAEVGRLLPPIIGSAVKVKLPEDVMQMYRDMHYRYKVEYTDEETGEAKMLPMFSASGVLHTLRAITAPAKVIAVADQLEDIDPKKKIVIGCWYKQTAKLMYDEIEKRKKRDKDFRPGTVVCITGDEPPAERRRLAMSASTAIVTIASMSEGINLYHMRGVMFLEEHYSPGANYQLLRRVRRDRNDDGRDVEPVLVWYFYVPKTADETIHKVSRQRGASAKDVLNEVFQ